MRRYQVDKREISYLKFLLEGYDNMAVVTTRDPQKGIVEVRIAPGCEDVVDSIITGIPGKLQ